MAEVIRMPRMSDTMEEGNIVAWHKQVGDEVEIGDLLAEIETDKATMDFESPAEGVILHIAIQEGTIPIGGVLTVIGEKGEDFQSLLSDTTVPSASEKKEEVVEVKEPVEVTSQPAEVKSNGVQPASNDDRIKASPLAKKMAEEANINLGSIVGTGDNGRIIKRDVESLIQKGGGSQPSIQKKTVATPQPVNLKVAETTSNTENLSEDIPVSQMRKVIARRLGESKFSAPHFYLTIEIDMDNTIAARKRINEIAPSKISFNDFVVKAAAVSLQQHPNINSSWLGDVIRMNKEINIGVAVAVDEGLLVPVIRNSNSKTLSQINAEVKELAGKAKNRKLQPQEMSGNTFTISNLGMFGIEEFTAIINPPDACILAVGGIIQKPVVKNGEIVVGNKMKVTLSCDHRVVDGVTGAKFLNTFKSILEDPIRMLV